MILYVWICDNLGILGLQQSKVSILLTLFDVFVGVEVFCGECDLGVWICDGVRIFSLQQRNLRNQIQRRYWGGKLGSNISLGRRMPRGEIDSRK